MSSDQVRFELSEFWKREALGANQRIATLERERTEDRAAIRALEHAAECMRAYFQALKGWQNEQTGYTAEVLAEMKGRVNKALWGIEEHAAAIARATQEPGA